MSEVLSSIRFTIFFFFFSSRRRHTRCLSDWSSDVCSSDLCPALHHHPDGIVEIAHHFERLGDAGNALVVECKAIEEGGAGAGCPCFRQIPGIGGEDVRSARAALQRHGGKRRVLLSGGRERKNARRLPGAQAKVVHKHGSGGGALGGPERRGHCKKPYSGGCF